MQRNLMTKKIKIHPRVGTAPLRAAQHVAIKPAGNIEVSHIERKMEKALHRASLLHFGPTAVVHLKGMPPVNGSIRLFSQRY